MKKIIALTILLLISCSNSTEDLVQDAGKRDVDIYEDIEINHDIGSEEDSDTRNSSPKVPDIPDIIPTPDPDLWTGDWQLLLISWLDTDFSMSAEVDRELPEVEDYLIMFVNETEIASFYHKWDIPVDIQEENCIGQSCYIHTEQEIENETRSFIHIKPQNQVNEKFSLFLNPNQGLVEYYIYVLP